MYRELVRDQPQHASSVVKVINLLNFGDKNARSILSGFANQFSGPCVGWGIEFVFHNSRTNPRPGGSAVVHFSLGSTVSSFSRKLLLDAFGSLVIQTNVGDHLIQAWALAVGFAHEAGL